MACGDRYASLIVTTSGLNLENPSGVIATIDDVLEWRELARKFGLIAQGMLDALGELGAPWDAWNEANEHKSAGVEAFDEIPQWVSTSPSEDIATAQRAISEYACAAELAEDAIVARGGTAPTVPGNTPPPDRGGGILDALGGDIPWGAIVLAGVAIYAFTRGRK